MNEGEIYHMFNGKLIGNHFMKTQVCKTLIKMSSDIVHMITSSCWFVSSMDDAWAFTFTGNDIKDNHLIFLSDDLLSQNTQQIQHSIAHEIGHVILGHRNAILSHQTKEEIQKQEMEADKFVKQFINS